MTDRERMALFEQQAEEAYTRMYEVTSNATACYSDAKEALYSAIGIARQLSDEDSVERLEALLAAIKAVFRAVFVMTWPPSTAFEHTVMAAKAAIHATIGAHNSGLGRPFLNLHFSVARV